MLQVQVERNSSTMWSGGGGGGVLGGAKKRGGEGGNFYVSQSMYAPWSTVTGQICVTDWIRTGEDS